MRNKLSRRDFLKLSGGAASIAVLVACAAPAPASAPSAGGSDVPAEEPIVIRYAGLETMGAAVERFLQPFLEERNITWERGSFGQQELTDKIMQSVATDTYLADMFQFPSPARADVIGANAIQVIPDEVLSNIDWGDVLPSMQSTLSWDGSVYALPYDGDIHYYAFRKDLFADSEISDRFANTYGYALDPENGAQTWQQWREIGEFFTGWDWNENGEEDDAGLACMTKRGDTLWWGFHSRSTAYAKHPDDPGYFFDIDTGEARLNNPGFVRALTEWVEENQKWAPPGGANYTYGESADAVRGARAVQTYSWDAVTQSSDPNASIIIGKQGYNILPGSHEVYNSKSGEWDSFIEPSHAPFHAFGGWAFAISTQVDDNTISAVWDVASHLASPESGLAFVTDFTGASPYRFSQFENVDAFANGPLQLGEDVAKDYLDAAKGTFDHPNWVSDIAVPGWVQYRDALELGVAKALAGEVSPEAGLEEVAAAFNEISERMGGLQSQAEIYRRTLGL